MMTAAKKKTKATPKATHKKEDAHIVFLRSLAEYGNVTKAAKMAKLDRCTLYRKRRESAEFSAVWDEAEAMGAASLEDEGRRRGYEGWLEPVFHKGAKCGSIRKYSDTLLIVLLKAHHPEKYQERKKTEFSGSFNADVQVYRIPDNGRD